MVNALRFPSGVCDRGKLRKLLGFMVEKGQKRFVEHNPFKKCDS